MKFGKQLLEAIQRYEGIALCPASEWVDYAALKKQLKAMSEAMKGTQSSTNNPHEKVFFSSLRVEVFRVDNRYRRLQNIILRDTQEFITQVQQQQSEFEDWNKYAELHSRLMFLEMFGILNYCAFTKILKKHDKLMHIRTREQYMFRMVENRTFAHLQPVRTAIDRLETLFREHTSSISKSESLNPNAAETSSSSTETLPNNVGNNSSKIVDNSTESEAIDRLNFLTQIAEMVSNNSSGPSSSSSSTLRVVELERQKQNESSNTSTKDSKGHPVSATVGDYKRAYEDADFQRPANQSEESFNKKSMKLFPPA